MTYEFNPDWMKDPKIMEEVIRDVIQERDGVIADQQKEIERLQQLTGDREALSIKFKRDYEELCNRYEMELAMCDVWGDGNYYIEIFDRKQKVFIFE